MDGSGTETIDIDGDPNIISANAQKRDDSLSELTIQILEDGDVIEQGSTTASYGVAQITRSDYKNHHIVENSDKMIENSSRQMQDTRCPSCTPTSDNIENMTIVTLS